MKKGFLYAPLAGIILLSSSAAVAGYKITVPVYVTDSSFGGAKGTARNSADTLQYIGCRDNGSNVFCVARDAAGVTKSCTATGATNIAVFRGSTDHSRLDVRFSAGECTSIAQTNTSYYNVQID